MLNESAYQEGRRGCAASPVPKHLPLMRAGDRAGSLPGLCPGSASPPGATLQKVWETYWQ